MTKREYVKWQPFNALIPGSKMVNDVLKEKNKVRKPSLSEDQIVDLENHLLEAYYNQDVIKIKFYRNGRYYLKQGQISKIDKINKIIVLGDAYQIFFKQIINFC